MGTHLLGAAHRFVRDWDRICGGSPPVAAVIEAILDTVAETSPPAPTGVMRAVPFRFTGSWLEAGFGFVICVVLPIYVYAPITPFSEGFGALERTILATAIAYIVAWYCARRLDAFLGRSLLDFLVYVAPIATVCYVAVGVIFLALRLDYSRVQLFGGGLLTLVWLLAVGQVRARLFIRSYAVVPAAALNAMPASRSMRWIDFEDALARSVRVDGLVADFGNDLSADQVTQVARAAISGVPILDRRHIVERLTGRTQLGGLTPNEYGALLPSREYLLARRILELMFTLLALPLLLPLLLIVALAIRLDSPGPVFFTQERVGYRGRVFRLIKFRTMLRGAEGPLFTAPDDRRVTSVGAVLRRYRLDELPQFLNILRGDMSWVGPRPEALALGRDYTRDIPHFELRGIVRPEITGWAQVNQGYAHTSDEMRAKLEYDLYYLKHCSLWLDLVIVLRTIGVVLGGIGAR